MMKHTPAPWRLGTNSSSTCHVLAPRRLIDPSYSFGTGDEMDPVASCRGDSEIRQANAPPLSAAPYLLLVCEWMLAWLTNVNTADPTELARMIMVAMEKAGYDKAKLDNAAVALVRGPCSCPNMMGDNEP